jgi:hypothetical protein
MRDRACGELLSKNLNWANFEIYPPFRPNALSIPVAEGANARRAIISEQPTAIAMIFSEELSAEICIGAGSLIFSIDLPSSAHRTHEATELETSGAVGDVYLEGSLEVRTASGGDRVLLASPQDCGPFQVFLPSLADRVREVVRLDQCSRGVHQEIADRLKAGASPMNDSALQKLRRAALIETYLGVTFKSRVRTYSTRPCSP